MNSLFRTDGHSTRYWRKLLAFDPVETFVLIHPADIALLRVFLHKYSDHLCAGYFSYDLGLALHGIQSQHTSESPLAVFHAYRHWVEGEKKMPAMGGIGHDVHENPMLKFEATVQRQNYKQGINEIKNFIRAGDVYQINYTQQLKSEIDSSPRELYPSLLERHPADYACFFEHADKAIHSLSPELFLHYKDGILSTEPIKGTRPRGTTPAEDTAQKMALLGSEKEQAELFMITDLLRNDLGKICEIGSVSLKAIKQLHQLPKVWHTSSRISGNVRSGLAPLDALISMLPGGSISGCPKKRALEIIDALEISSRGIYTGSLGYFHPDGDFSFNIAIRTLVQEGRNIKLGTGGGITIDSNWEAEWEEILVKASTFM
ncbi:MAG: anthranilate synthase component I family protein [Candidatus Marinimicrobia bacterium]|nr:anthranilate synthase component I family protein [Candidatus Neomarinimicrobiota bacterium]